MKERPQALYVHMLTPGLTVLCWAFSFKGQSIVKTTQPELVTCPSCLQRMKPAAKKASP